MKKAILSPRYGAQEIPELETLEQGEECLRVSCPDALFFWGDDGNRYYALETGRFE